ncbi:unnamed protein product, partial [Iphiclides podalirius]
MRLLLVLFILLNGTASLYVQKTIETNYPKTLMFTDLMNKKKSPILGLRQETLLNSRIDSGFAFPNIDKLLTTLKIPGYNVYLLNFKNFNTKETRRYSENSNMMTHLENELETKKTNYNAFVNEKNIKIIRNNLTEVRNENYDPYQSSINTDCDGGDSLNIGKCIEQATTTASDILNDTTTNSDFLNENSTTTSSYDDETDYGSLADRIGISPELLASMVG